MVRPSALVFGGGAIGISKEKASSIEYVATDAYRPCCGSGNADVEA
jgi:hypothetical protein